MKLLSCEVVKAANRTGRRTTSSNVDHMKIIQKLRVRTGTNNDCSDFC